MLTRMKASIVKGFNQMPKRRFSALPRLFSERHINHPVLNSEQKEELKFKKFQEEQARRKKITTFALYSVLSLTTTGIILYLWQPWNPYTTEVSRDLRKGLWAESESEDNDYLKALKHYQLALKACNEEGMSQTDQKYTGIVLKIIEMYEKLGMIDKERETCKSLGDFLFGKLVNGEIEDINIDKIIQRDLTVTSRYVTLAEKRKVDELLDELLDRIVFAEGRISNKWPFLKPLKVEQLSVEQLMDMSRSWDSKKSFIKTKLDPEAYEFLNTWLEPEWPVFLDELISTRDLYATLGMLTNKGDLAINLMKSNLLWMKLSNHQPIYIGTVLTNLASAYFMKAERGKVIVDKVSKELRSENDENKKLYYQMILDYQLKEYNESIQQSENIHTKLISLYDVPSYKDDFNMQACIGLSLYSLGVIKLHQSKFKDSLSYFMEAKERAAEEGNLQLAIRIDDELETLNEVENKHS